MLTSSISNTKWCHSVGESCNFMDLCIISFALADVIADVFGQLCCILLITLLSQIQQRCPKTLTITYAKAKLIIHESLKLQDLPTL